MIEILTKYFAETVHDEHAALNAEGLLEYLKENGLKIVTEKSRIRKLENAISRYGKHDDGCMLETWHGKGSIRCSCGFAQALED